MTDEEIYQALRADCKADPLFAEAWSGEQEPCRLKFTKRSNGNYYVSVEMPRGPLSSYETGRQRFAAWLRPKLDKYGWKYHVTSGGMGSYTFRLNSDLY